MVTASSAEPYRLCFCPSQLCHTHGMFFLRLALVPPHKPGLQYYQAVGPPGAGFHSSPTLSFCLNGLESSASTTWISCIRLERRDQLGFGKQPAVCNRQESGGGGVGVGGGGEGALFGGWVDL